LSKKVKIHWGKKKLPIICNKSMWGGGPRIGSLENRKKNP
jgi:hypothetical protein